MRTREGDKEQDILTVSIEIFGKNGYSSAKMHQIAEKAGIGIGTVYLYFRNKEKILQRIFDTVWSKLADIVVLAGSNNNLNPLQKLESLIDSVFNYFAENPNISNILVYQHPNTIAEKTAASYLPFYIKAHHGCEAIFIEGQKQGFFNTAINPHFIRTFVFGGIRNSLLQWSEDTDKISLDELRMNITTVLLVGIRSQ